MSSGSQEIKKVLLVKEKLDFEKLPNRDISWLDELSRGLLNQSSFYLNKNSNNKTESIVTLLPKDSEFQQILLINQNRLPSKSKILAVTLKDADFFYTGKFTDSEIVSLNEILPKITKWK